MTVKTASTPLFFQAQVKASRLPYTFVKYYLQGRLETEKVLAGDQPTRKGFNILHTHCKILLGQQNTRPDQKEQKLIIEVAIIILQNGNPLTCLVYTIDFGLTN